MGKEKKNKGAAVKQDADTIDSLFADNATTTTNAVGLSGEIIELSEAEQISGLRFNGYIGKISTPRPSGAEDTVVFAFEPGAVSTPDKEAVEAAGVLNVFTVGSRLLISGRMQTLKDFETGKVLVFVLADFVGLCPTAALQNDVVITGKLAKKPTARTTQRGKHITDIMLTAQNMLTAGSSYIPCICWGDTADEVANWDKGETVSIQASIRILNKWMMERNMNSQQTSMVIFSRL